MILLVPSRGRPDRAALMVASAKETAWQPLRVLVIVDSDDETLPEYQRGLSDLLVLPERTGYSGALNAGAQAVWDAHTILGAFGDDVLFRTPGWDVQVAAALERPGIAYGNDLAHGPTHATAVWMSSVLAKALGWLALPDCRHQYVDNAWVELGRATNTLRYLPDVIVEHMHVAYEKAEWDATYREVYSQPQAGIDHAAYMAWKQHGLEPAAKRLLSAA